MTAKEFKKSMHYATLWPGVEVGCVWCRHRIRCNMPADDVRNVLDVSLKCSANRGRLFSVDTKHFCDAFEHYKGYRRNDG